MPAAATGNFSGLGTEIFRLAVEICPSGILVSDADGRIVLANSEIERLFGYDRAELLGRSVEILLPEKLRDKHLGQRRAYSTATRRPLHGTARDLNGRRKDGSEFPVEVGAQSDQSRRRTHGGERHRRRQRTHSAGANAGRVRRDREPRTAHADDVDRRLARPPARRRRQGPAAAGHASFGDRLRQLRTPDPADQRHSGHQEARSRPDAFPLPALDAGLLLEKAIEANRGFADSLGVHFEAPPDPVELYVDPDRFIQAITNLLSNAVNILAARRDGGRHDR